MTTWLNDFWDRHNRDEYIKFLKEHGIETMGICDTRLSSANLWGVELKKQETQEHGQKQGIGQPSGVVLDVDLDTGNQPQKLRLTREGPIRVKIKDSSGNIFVRTVKNGGLIEISRSITSPQLDLFDD